MEQVSLEVKNLKKYFNTPKGLLHAVDNVNFRIYEGKTFGVFGESGCGKSTLGRVILHLLDSTDGQILFEGEDVTHVDKAKLRALREKMQIIFQDPYSSLNPRMSVSEIIMEPLQLKGGMSHAEMYEKTKKLMDTVGLAARLENAYPHELDGGRRQRIGIARALALNPRFIVCDEPISALDVSIQAQVINMLKELQDDLGLTYLFIAHDLSVVKYISDRVIVMYLGTVVEEAPADELYAHPTHPYTKALLSSIPVADPKVAKSNKRIHIKGEIPSPINPKECCQFADRCVYATDRCRAEVPKRKEIEPGHFVSCHLMDQ